MHRKLDNLLSPAKANIVQKELKAEYVADLLYYFPRKYVDRTIQPVALKEGNSVGLVVTVESVYHIFQRRSQLILRTRTEKGEMIECIWFHSPRYMQKIFSNNPQMFVFGKIQRQKNVFRIFHPDFEIVTDEENTESSEIDRIVPFYPISSVLKKNHLDNRSLRRIIHKILETAIVSEIIPKSLLVKHRLVSRSVAIHNIHFPKNSIHLNRAIHRLKFEELFALNCHVFYRGGQNKCKERKAFPIPINTSKLQQKMLKSLPFSLTDDQKNAIHIFFNKISEKPALRILLQGDVGCGKTLTALSIGLHYIEADYQIALMVPTEVLAKQHFLTFANLMGMEFGNQMDILIGSLNKKRRSMILERIRSGQSQIVIGTHSLLSNEVKFKNLGLVIIDEQHRFGVDQRKVILQKGIVPDLLAMSATPIPRSLCLTTFSDLDLITIREKPKNRGNIKTLLFTEERRTGVYNSIRKYIQKNDQCYIVYPIISESEKLDIQAAQKSYEDLKEGIFSDCTVSLLHGRMKSKDKDKIMQQMKAGKIDILVTTSVIEVGVDCPNATIMLIESAERFGISQLHQLRGRVGRGEKDSHCVLLTQLRHLENPETETRLKTFCKTTDGFILAELDLRLRGAGEILGKRQHGFDSLMLANLVKDQDLVSLAYKEARQYLQLNERKIMNMVKNGNEKSELYETNTKIENIGEEQSSRDFWKFVEHRFQNQQLDVH